MDNQGLGTLDATGELAEQLERIGTQILNASRAEYISVCVFGCSFKQF